MTPELKDLIGEPVAVTLFPPGKDSIGKYAPVDLMCREPIPANARLYTATQLQPLIQRLEEAERLICEIDRCVGLGEGVGIDHYMIGLAADRDFQTVMAILAANTPPNTQDGEAT